MSARASLIRRSFLEQADLCEQFGSPFTARLIRALEGVLTHESMTGRTVLSWEGPPEANGDALALRLCGALHALVLGHHDADLASIYPPNETASEDTFRAALLQAIDRNDTELVQWLARAPQTNEVGRSSLLFLGLLEISRLYRLPLRLFEIGSSAGLNLALDQYGYDFGGVRFGDTDSALQLQPAWSGPSPASGSVCIKERRGCDVSPVNVATDRIRLQSYVWPDQEERHHRLIAAIGIAQEMDLVLDQSDAERWVKEHISEHRPSGLTTVLMHSLTFRYLRPEGKAAITHHIESLGNTASNDCPLAWLGFELNDDNQAELTLQTWPTGEKRVIATAHPHGRWIDVRKPHEVP